MQSSAHTHTHTHSLTHTHTPGSFLSLPCWSSWYVSSDTHTHTHTHTHTFLLCIGVKGPEAKLMDGCYALRRTFALPMEQERGILSSFLHSFIRSIYFSDSSAASQSLPYTHISDVHKQHLLNRALRKLKCFQFLKL